MQIRIILQGAQGAGKTRLANKLRDFLIEQELAGFNIETVHCISYQQPDQKAPVVDEIRLKFKA